MKNNLIDCSIEFKLNKKSKMSYHKMSDFIIPPRENTPPPSNNNEKGQIQAQYPQQFGDQLRINIDELEDESYESYESSDD